MKHFLWIFLSCMSPLAAQQTMMFTQYTFNKGGLNPAANGTDINQKYYFSAGANRPWTGISGAPKQNFFNFSVTYRQPRSLSFWQTGAVYVENEQGGLMSQNNIYAGYAVHLLLRKKLVFSAGLFAGIRMFTRNIGSFDPNDPAVGRNSELMLYPDLIPGFRLENKGFFADLSIRQISITQLRDFNGRKIGSPSRLMPGIYADYGVKIPVMENILMMPSVACNLPVLAPPSVDGTIMFYFYNRCGGGLAIRNLSFVTGIFQLRFLRNVTAGIAYSYPVNATRLVAGHSFEFMIGMVPTGMDVKVTGKHSIARCPTLEY